MENKFICSECKSVYFYYKNLRKHVRKAHPEKINDIAPVQKSKKSFKYKCGICGKQFNHSYNFRYHQRKMHNLETGGVFNGRRPEKLKCPLCTEIYPLKKKLFSHIECVHNINIQVDNLQVASFQEFIKWKEKIENETTSKYIKEHGSKKDTDNIKHYFVCHRSGHYSPEVKRQRKLKSQGSQKINGICPASLLVHETENSVCNIQYISTHVGHKLDTDHLYLTATEKKCLATEIANKIPFQTIIEKARNRLTDSKQSRITRLKKKDLYNIQRKLCAPGNINNLESIILEINSNESSVLFYKLPNTVDERYPDLNGFDFVLIIMNEWQCEILKKHGSNFICVDKTNKLNYNGFELITIMTIDDYRQAYPCAFLISNRCDQCVLKLFFDYIKLQTGVITTSVFMSSVEDCVFNAWIATMDEPKIRHYCTWLVQEEWDKHLLKMSNVDKRTQVLGMLKEFMCEHDSDGFEIKLRIIIQQLIENQETTEFGKYLSANFLKNTSCWALCYRYRDCVDMNPNLERVHTTLKHLFISGKNYKQLDLSLYSINGFIYKMLLNDFVIVQGKEIEFLNKDIQTRHEDGCRLLTNLLIDQVEGGWKVQSAVDPQDVYFIRQFMSDCSCKLTCIECDICIHKYVCTCSDSYIEWNMCQHIHLVCSYINSHQSDHSVKLFIAEDAFSIPFESEVVISECGEILVQINESNCSEMNNVIKINSEVGCLNESDKEHIKQEFIELIDGITNENDLDIVRESMSTLKALLSATQARTICVASSESVKTGNSENEVSIISETSTI